MKRGSPGEMAILKRLDNYSCDGSMALLVPRHYGVRLGCGLRWTEHFLSRDLREPIEWYLLRKIQGSPQTG